MKRNGCFVVWPRNRQEKLTVRCTVDASQPGAFVRLKDWPQRSATLLEQQLQNFRFAKEEILHEIWAQV